MAVTLILGFCSAASSDCEINQNPLSDACDCAGDEIMFQCDLKKKKKKEKEITESCVCV